jgi:hypothetical protein
MATGRALFLCTGSAVDKNKGQKIAEKAMGTKAHNLFTPERMQLLMDMSISCVLEPAQKVAIVRTMQHLKSMQNWLHRSNIIRKASWGTITFALCISSSCKAGLSPSSTAGMARYRARGLSAEPPAKMMAWTLLLMSSTVITPILLVVLLKPLYAVVKGVLWTACRYIYSSVCESIARHTIAC